MVVAAGVILMWPSTAASIPTGWTRVTALDGMYVKGSDDAGDVSSAGHTHSVPAHVHTQSHSHGISPSSVASTTVLSRDGGSGGSGAAYPNHQGGAYHTGATAANADALSASSSKTSGSNTVDLDRMAVIFIQSAGTHDAPAGAVAWFNDTPALAWDYCDGGGGRPDLRNRYVKGAAAAGNGGGTSAASSHTHTTPEHIHTLSHDHPATTVTDSILYTGVFVGGFPTIEIADTHGHSVPAAPSDFVIYASAPATGGQSPEPPYYKLNAVVADSLTPVVNKIIAIWMGELGAIPTNWVLCNGQSGTPNLIDKFIKATNTTGELGNTGGSADHLHTLTHSHTPASHDHSSVTSGVPDDTFTAITGTFPQSSPTHTHTMDFVSDTTASGSTSPTLGNGSNEPTYTEVIFIMYNEPPPPTPGPVSEIMHHYRKRREN